MTGPHHRSRYAGGSLRSGRILVQMAAIIAVGFGLGLADAYMFRKIDLAPRAAPPTIEEALAAANSGKKPAPGTATPDGGTSHTAPAPAEKPEGSTPDQPSSPASPNNTPGTPTPAPAGFVFTPKDKLPAGHITIEDARKLFDAGAVFVDSRKESEYVTLHVENAYRIETSMFKAGDPAKLALIPRDSIVVVYCNGGNCDESDNLAKLLDGSGYKTVYVMHDGIPGWAAAGHPTATGADPFDLNP